MKSDNSLIKEFSNEKFDIIILAGQSNAQGHGMGPVEEPFVASDRIMYLCDNSNIHFEKNEQGEDYLFLPEECQKSIRVAQEVGEFDKPDGQRVGNLSLIFAKKYLNNGLLDDGRKLLIIHSAVGGTGFAKKQWGVGNVLYERLVDMTKVALELNPENRIVAILWHQGEHDAFENADMKYEDRSDFYYSSISSMFDDYFDRFSLKNVPIIAGGFCDEWYLKNKEACDAVIDGTKRFLQAVNGRFVESAGLLSNNQKIHNYDDIHFCRESLYILGEKYYSEFEAILSEKQN